MRRTGQAPNRRRPVNSALGVKNMPNKPPKLIAIDHDDYAAEFVGKTADGRQFFLTTPFEPAIGGKAGEEFVALYLFDTKGALVEAKIESFGIALVERVTSDDPTALIGLPLIALCTLLAAQGFAVL